jgi:hypothetical protein
VIERPSRRRITRVVETGKNIKEKDKDKNEAGRRESIKKEER